MTDEDWKKINRISEEYYRNWDWNYGKSPDFNFSRQKRFSIGSIEVHLNVSEGMIKEAKSLAISFRTRRYPLTMEKNWLDRNMIKHLYQKIVSQIDVKKYFGAIEPEELLTLLLENKK